MVPNWNRGFTQECLPSNCCSYLLGGCVFGDGLGALRDGVLSQFTRKQEADSSLDLPGGDGRALVVMGQAGSLGSDALKDVVHERVHDGHGLGRDTGVGVDLLQHLVDVDGITFLPPPLLFLITLGNALLSLASLLGGLSRSLGRHSDDDVTSTLKPAMMPASLSPYRFIRNRRV